MTYCDIPSNLDEGQFSSKTVCKKIIEICYMTLELQYFEQHSVKILKNPENKFGPQRVKQRELFQLWASNAFTFAWGYPCECSLVSAVYTVYLTKLLLKQNLKNKVNGAPRMQPSCTCLILPHSGQQYMILASL